MQQPSYQLLNPIAFGAAIAVVGVLAGLVLIPMMAMTPMMGGMGTMHVVGLVIALVGGFVIGFLVAWIYNVIVRRMAPAPSRTP